MELTGVLMAGGKSSRMKKDKGFVLYHGKMMASYGLEVLKATCQSCFISTNNPDYQLFKTPMVKDIHQGIGPLGGLHAALVHSSSQYIVVLGCDLPNINTKVIDLLKLNLENADAIIPMHDVHQTEPLVAVYSKSILPVIEDMIQKKDYKMHHLLRNVNTSYIPADHLISIYPKLFYNVNSSDELIQ